RGIPLRQRIFTAGLSNVWALGSRTPMRAAYQAAHGLACRFLTVEDFYSGCAARDGINAQHSVREIAEKINAVARRIVDISYDVDAAVAAWTRRLGDLSMLISAAQKKERVPQQLLLTNLRQPHLRAVALALRRRGVEIMGLPHADDMPAQPIPDGNIGILLALERVVVPSNAWLRWAQDEYRSSRVSDRNNVEFERTSLPLYREWLEEGRRSALPPRVETVMIVGFPPNWIRYPHLVGHWSLSQLDVEITLIKVLSAEGF